MPEWTTVGEGLVGRRLTMANRAGVPHYVTGQLQADVEHVFDPETNDDLGWAGTVSWVDAMGQARVLVVNQEDGVWHPIMHAAAGVRLMRGKWEPADDHNMTETMLAALTAAYDKALREENDNA